jgi:hypothetical protein
MTPRRRGHAVLLLAVAAFAGCTALKFSYNRLDWIAAWQVGRFVDLDSSQESLFEDRFRELWQWHRGTQLELYVRDINEIAARLERPLPPAKVEEYLDRSQQHLARVLSELGPDTAKVIATFDDEQVAELTAALAKKRRARQEESEGMTTEELREEAEEQMTRNLKRWIGSPTREQQQRIHKWATGRAYAGTIWFQYQEAWASAFTELLQHRREPDFEKDVAEMFDHARVPYGEEMVKVQEHNRAAWIALMADLSAMLTPDQRKHAQQRLREFAADLEELAKQPAKAALTPSPAQPGSIG